MIDSRSRNYYTPTPAMSVDQQLSKLAIKCANLEQYCDNLEERIQLLEDALNNQGIELECPK